MGFLNHQEYHHRGFNSLINVCEKTTAWRNALNLATLTVDLRIAMDVIGFSASGFREWIAWCWRKIVGKLWRRSCRCINAWSRVFLKRFLFGFYFGIDFFFRRIMNPYLKYYQVANFKHVKCFMNFSGMFLLMISGFRLKLTEFPHQLYQVVSLVALDHPFGYEERGHGAMGFGSEIDEWLPSWCFTRQCIEVLCEFEIGYNIL